MPKKVGKRTGRKIGGKAGVVGGSAIGGAIGGALSGGNPLAVGAGSYIGGRVGKRVGQKAGKRVGKAIQKKVSIPNENSRVHLVKLDLATAAWRRQCAQCAPSCSPQSPYAHAIGPSYQNCCGEKACNREKAQP